jgi:DNA repair protein RecN (Recombination protein N)
MLTELYLKNYILIPELRLNFKPGMTVLTGETGAGKSIIVGALNLVFGKASPNQIAFDPAKDVYLEITFELPVEYQEIHNYLNETGIRVDDDELIIAREFTAGGKTASFINGKKTSATVLKELHDLLIDFHHQRDQQSLLNSGFQLDLLDKYGALMPLRIVFQQQFNELKHNVTTLKALQEADANNLKLIELYKFQLDELNAAELISSNNQSLEKEFELLLHSEEIISLATELYVIFYERESSIYDLLTGAQAQLEKYSDMSSLISDINAKLGSGIENIQDASVLLRTVKERIASDPERLAEIRQRLDLLNSLMGKYKCITIDDLISYKNKIEQAVQSQENNQAEIQALSEKIGIEFEKLTNTAEELSSKRLTASNKLAGGILTNLMQLSIPSAQLEIRIDKKADGKILLTDISRFFSDTGQDTIEIRFSANPDSPVLPLKSIVSGGELSRILLAAKKSLAQVLPPRTIILDEIDVGIGGKTAGALADFIHKLAENHQVICITHLAKIAAAADEHISIDKKTVNNATVIEIEHLDAERKINEIARMLSGHITELSVKHAKELLSITVR